MPQITYPFSNSSNYIFNSDKVKIENGKVSLKLLQAQQDYVEDFADDTDFVYDSDKVEFVDGKLKQKNARPSNATFYASYNSSINGNWGNGSLIGTAYGGASISDGKLDLAYSDQRYVDYNAVNNADSQQVGCVRFKIIPNYSGTPSNDRWIFAICKQNNNRNNLIQLRHSNSGAYLRLHVYDKDGNSVVEHLCGTFSPTAGTEYEIELDWDFTTGATRLFVNGVQSGATCTSTCLRDSDIGLLRIGNDYDKGAISDFKINDFLIFSTVQHISNYTPDWSDIAEYKYLKSNVILPEMEHTVVGTFLSFDEFATVESGIPKYTVQIGRSGNYLYWNGSDWVVSDGTYAQANDGTTFNAHVGDLDVEEEIYKQFKIHFTDTDTQGEVDNLVATVTEQTGYSTDNPNVVPTSGVLSDALEDLEETIVEAGSDAAKFTISVDGVQKYWDGSQWGESSGYVQSNSADEVINNLVSLDLILGATVKPIIYLHSDDGQSTPEVDEVSMTYNFFAEQGTIPETCIVYGYLIDADGGTSENTTIEVRMRGYNVLDSDKFVVSEEVITANTRDNGYFEVVLIKSTEFEGDGLYDFKVTFSSGKVQRFTKVTIPDQDTINFHDLI